MGCDLVYLPQWAHCSGSLWWIPVGRSLCQGRSSGTLAEQMFRMFRSGGKPGPNLWGPYGSSTDGSAGELSCGSTVTGDTSNAEHNVGTVSGERYYTLEVPATRPYVFST